MSAVGGKLLLYHGWNDPVVSVHATIDYYLRVSAALAQAQMAGSDQVRDFYRLFLGAGNFACAVSNH